MIPHPLRFCLIAFLLLGGGLLVRAQTLPTSNPYVAYINQWIDPSPSNPNGIVYAIPTNPGPTPGSTFSVWTLETNLRYALPAIWAATDPRNTANAAKKQQMRDNVEAVLDNVFSLLDPVQNRWWWPGASGRSGDPNVDRFILLILCDVLHRSRTAGLYPAKMDGWLAQLKPAIDFQLANYGAASALDWSTVAAGQYANIDAAYALIMGLAARLYSTSPDAALYSASANQFAHAQNERVFPDGATPYWISSNEILHYHNYVTLWMSRYYEVSGDLVAFTLLQRMSRYLPLALGNLSTLSGDFTSSARVELKYLDPWWKFTAEGEPDPVTPAEVFSATPAIAASYSIPGSLTQRQNQWAANRLIYKSNNGLNPAHHWGVTFAYSCYFAVDRWALATNAAPILAAHKLQRTRNSRGPLPSPHSPDPAYSYSNGFVGRFAAPDNRTFGWLAAPGNRQRTFGAAWLMNNGDLSRDTALQMVMAEVRETAGTGASQLRNVSSYHAGSTVLGASLTTPTFGAFGVQYRPTRPYIAAADERDGVNFEVRQLGLYTPTHVISFVEMESLAAQSRPYIAIRVRSDRTSAQPTTVNLAIETPGAELGIGQVYAIGNLRHRIVTNSLPTLSHGAAVNDTATDQTHHERADEFILSRGSAVNPAALPAPSFTLGELHRAVIDTYPLGYAPANDFAPVSFPGTVVGFQIVIDAYRYHVLFNRSGSDLALSNYNIASNPGSTAVLYSSARPDVGGHHAPVPITGTTFTENKLPPGGLLVVRVATEAHSALKSRDLGSTTLAGGHHAQPGPLSGEYRVTLHGAGGAMGTSDPAHFLTSHRPTTDGALSVRLHHADRPDAFAKYGIMIRADETSPGAPALFLRYNPESATSNSGQVKMQWRTTANGTLTIGSSVNLTLPCWLRIARIGDTFTAFTSINGTAWNQLGSPATLAGFPAAAFWGLAANSNTNTQAGSAYFDHLAFTAFHPTAPTGLTATVNGSQVNLAWTSVPTAATYTVQRAAAPGGPYTVIASGLSSPSHTDSTATPGQTAYYVVAATNVGGDGPASAEVSILPLTLRQIWRQAHFNTIANTGDAADLADPDGDGVNNVLEYALAGDPVVPSNHCLPTGSLLPAPASSLQLTLTRHRADLTYIVEGSFDLALDSWLPIAINPGTLGQSVTVTDPESALPRRFLRLRIIAPE